MLDGNEIIGLVSSGELSVLAEINNEYKNEFCKWASCKFPKTNKYDIADCWHDVILSFYDQVCSGKLLRIHFELKSYLFGAGHHILVKRLMKSRNITYCESLEESLIKGWYGTDSLTSYNDKIKCLSDSLQELPEKSQKLLTSRFLEGMSLKDIASEANYRNLNSLSVTLSRSLKSLRIKVKQKAQSQVFEDQFEYS